jgi:DNA ligase-1
VVQLGRRADSGGSTQEAAMSTPFALNRRALLVAALASPCAAQAGPAPALLLAQDAPDALHPAGWLVSEKLDGVRALWDGRQLRSRSGRSIAAPAWFTQALPATPLDGELWGGRGRFEATNAALHRKQPQDADWQALRYMVFEQPGGAGTFAQRAQALQRIARDAHFAGLAALPQDTLDSHGALRRRLAEVVAGGGEGLMLHRADAPYTTGRSALLLKLKPLHDAEALVLAHQPGRGRHAGRLGALRVQTRDGVAFDLGTGFTDAQRAQPPAVGQWVTFSHRGLTAHGVPRFASFVRVHAAL